MIITCVSEISYDVADVPFVSSGLDTTYFMLLQGTCKVANGARETHIYSHYVHFREKQLLYRGECIITAKVHD